MRKNKFCQIISVQRDFLTHLGLNGLPVEVEVGLVLLKSVFFSHKNKNLARQFFSSLSSSSSSSLSLIADFISAIGRIPWCNHIWGASHDVDIDVDVDT